MGERLSMLDTMFLDLEQFDEAAHMHIGAALIFQALPDGGTPEIGVLREYLRGRIESVPRFTQQLSGPHAGPLRWLTWEPAGRFDLAGHVHHATLPSPGGDAELREWLGDFWSHRLDRRRPLWEMALLDGLADGRWALATKVHHCLVDGVGSLDIGRVLLDSSPEPVTTQERKPAGGGGRGGENGDGRMWLSPGALLHGARAGMGAAAHPRRSLERARAALELIVREEVIGAPHTSLNGPMSGVRRYETVALDLGEVVEVKRRLGGTLNDLVLALCAGGLRALLLSRGETPSAGLRAQVPVNIRREDREHALGNELTSLFVELPVAEADPGERHRRVRERARELKAGSQRAGGKTIVDLADMGPPLAGGLLARAMFGDTRMFNLTITNVPGPSQQLYALGAPLVEMLPLVPLFAGHTIGIAILTYGGWMFFGLNADALAAPDVGVLAEGIARSFAELKASARSPHVARRQGRASPELGVASL